MKNVEVQLYGSQYGDNTLVYDVLAKRFGFELSIQDSKGNIRQILSLEEVMNLKLSLEKALEEYDQEIKKMRNAHQYWD